MTVNTTALEMIDHQIESVKMDIEFTESSLAQAIATLESRTATVASRLAGGFEIFDTGLVEAALKVDQLGASRRSSYVQLNGLLRTRKAAGGE